MKYNPDKHHRRTIRLKDYDYSRVGAYFVTICTQVRECLFGDITSDEMQLNRAGEMIQKTWKEIPLKYSHIEIDEFLVMPNHIHGIIIIKGNYCRGEVFSPAVSLSGSITNLSIQKGGDTPPLQIPTLGRIIAYFKYQSTKQINLINNSPGTPLWQRNYYEHIIRNENELNRIRE
ncbi:MAG: transposase [Nitrospira sp.]|nr:transposase [Nitrospira sp.]